MSGYTVERTIENVEFEESHVEEIREQVRHNMVDEGHTNINEDEVEERTKERLVELAEDRTLHEQGDNRLHHDISHTELE